MDVDNISNSLYTVEATAVHGSEECSLNEKAGPKADKDMTHKNKHSSNDFQVDARALPFQTASTLFDKISHRAFSFARTTLTGGAWAPRFSATKIHVPQKRPNSQAPLHHVTAPARSLHHEESCFRNTRGKLHGVGGKK